MKRILTVLVFLLALNLSAQESILDVVAKETCEYLDSNEIRDLSKKDKTMKLGIFIISKYSEYKEKFLEEGIQIDLANDGSNSGREFGEKVGMNMVKFCPKTLMTLAGGDNSNEYEEDEYVIDGKLNSVKGNDFSTIVLKDSSGKLQKFLWLENFKGSEKLIGNKSIKGLNVKVTYKNFECYSAQLEEYVIRKKIIAINYLDE